MRLTKQQSTLIHVSTYSGTRGCIIYIYFASSHVSESELALRRLQFTVDGSWVRFTIIALLRRSGTTTTRTASLGPDCANDAVQAATWKCNGSALVLFLTLNISSSTSTASNNLTFVRRKAKIILQAPGAGSSLKTVMLPRPIPKSERPSKSAFIRQRNLRNRS